VRQNTSAWGLPSDVLLLRSEPALTAIQLRPAESALSTQSGGSQWRLVWFFEEIG